jgi:hypothetical protein
VRAATALVLALLAACTRDAPAGDWPSTEPYGVTTTALPAPPGRKIDLLFMLDNTNSMEPKRQSLIQYFPNLATTLADFDLHIGIVTSSMGAGPFTPPSCATIGGDQGMLQNQRHGWSCSTAGMYDPDARFLTYEPAVDGGAPSVNFAGALGDAFECHAAIMEDGCGFEMPLASVRAALNGCGTPGRCTQPINEGFLREDALLAIVMLTDEDDCSAPPDTTLFDPSQRTLDSALGPITSYRCFEFGNLCGGEDPGRSMGLRHDCVPGNKDPDPLHQLTPLEEFATFLQALRPDPGSLYVAVIAGTPGPVQVGPDANNYPDLVPACTGGVGSADPTPRLSAFLRLLPPQRGRFFSTCEPDLSETLKVIGTDLLGASTCLGGWLRHGIPDAGAFTPECLVVDRLAEEERPIPPCDPVLCDASDGGAGCAHEIPAGAPGCWYLQADDTCPLYALSPDGRDSWRRLGSGLRLVVDRGTGSAAAPGTVTVATCGTCVAAPQDWVFDCSAGCADYWPDRCLAASVGG